MAEGDGAGEAPLLRETRPDDLAVFFAQERDPEARRMAAFTAEDPDDRDVFTAHWKRLLTDETVLVRTIVAGGAVAGHVAAFEREGKPEVTYWIGREHWGRGLATRSLRELLTLYTRRPLYARAAKDNAASLRVLARCGFRVVREERGFANARGEEVAELVLELAAD